MTWMVALPCLAVFFFGNFRLQGIAAISIFLGRWGSCEEKRERKYKKPFHSSGNPSSQLTGRSQLE